MAENPILKTIDAIVHSDIPIRHQHGNAESLTPEQAQVVLTKYQEDMLKEDTETAIIYLKKQPNGKIEVGHFQTYYLKIDLSGQD